MPLLDHFRGPLSDARHWESFHGGWAYEMMAALNRDPLPEGYFADAQVHVGSQVFADEIEVEVFKLEGGRTLVATVELISPGNKNRSDTRRTLAAKCAAYLLEAKKSPAYQAGLC